MQGLDKGDSWVKDDSESSTSTPTNLFELRRRSMLSKGDEPTGSSLKKLDNENRNQS